MKINRIVKYGAALIVVIMVGRFFLSRNRNAAIDLPVAAVERLAKFSDRAQCTGRVTSLGEQFLTVQRGGRLEELSIAVGSQVRKGQVLAVVDKTANSAGLKAALSSFRLAQKEYGRIASLSRSGSASREELDRSLSAMEVKRAELEKAKQSVEDGLVRSPIDGKVSVLVFRTGDKVPDGSRVAAVVEQTGVQLACRMPASIANKLSATAATKWSAIDTDSEWQTQSEVGLNQQSNAFVGLEREVRLTSRDPQLAAAIGQLVRIEIMLPEVADVAKLPSAAVVSKSAGDFIFVRDAQHQISMQKVQVLKRDQETAMVVGVPLEGQVLVINVDVSKVEAMISKKDQPTKGG